MGPAGNRAGPFVAIFCRDMFQTQIVPATNQNGMSKKNGAPANAWRLDLLPLSRSRQLLSPLPHQFQRDNTTPW